MTLLCQFLHDDFIKWKQFPHYWTFVRGIHQSPLNTPHKSQWRGALVFSLICAWTNGSVNDRNAADLRRHRAHYDVTVKGWRCFQHVLFFSSTAFYQVVSCAEIRFVIDTNFSGQNRGKIIDHNSQWNFGKLVEYDFISIDACCLGSPLV